MKQNILSAAKWSALTEIATKAVNPISYIVLARILTPTDFGVIAIATLVVTFSQIFWEAGLSKALIQYQGEIEPAANLVFYLNFIFAVVAYCIVFFSADHVSTFFDDERVALVLIILGFQIILTALSSVQIALFQKILDFKSLFVIRTYTTIAPIFISIPLALLGYGYWSLVIGLLVGSLIQLIISWWKSEWRPTLNLEVELTKPLLKFGGWITLDAFVIWLAQRIDILLIGTFFDTRTLGLYEMAKKLVDTVFGLALSPLFPILYSAYSKLQKQKEKLEDFALITTQLMVLISIIVAFCLAMTGGVIEQLILGDKWAGIAKIITLLSFATGLAWCVGTFPERYRVSGRPDISTKITLIGLIFAIPLYFFAVKKGLDPFLWSRIIAVCFSVIVSLVVAKKILQFPTNKYGFWVLKYTSIGFVGYSVFVFYGMNTELNTLRSIVQLFLGLSVLGIILLIIDRKKLMATVGKIKHARIKR